MRGKKVKIEEYLTNLEPYLVEGCSLHEACLHSGIPYTTMVDYSKNDENVRNKIHALQNQPILDARKSVNREAKIDGNLALKFLERKLKKEFSPRSEITGEDGGPIKQDTKWTVEVVEAKTDE